MSLRIALAGNPNSGKTTLFNALTGSNQHVGNWPGVTVEKKEGKLKKNSDVIITDLPGIYSLSPYTLEEVVARNYLIGERPDAILNIVDGTNLERNLYLTTQLIEIGVPVVIAINMMDIVRKDGDVINIKRLSEELGCPIVEISALKNDGIEKAAEIAVEKAKEGKPIAPVLFSGAVEHALAHIEEATVHHMPEDQQRWYSVKIFERDNRVIENLNIEEHVREHIEEDIKRVEEKFDDDAESIITNDRYVYIERLMKTCYKKKNAGKLSISDRIDNIVTNKFLALPIFVGIMWFVYYLSIGSIGDWTVGFMNDTLFGGSAWVATSAYFIGIGAVILSGLLLKKTKAFSGDPAPFVMELPAYHAPVMGNILRTTWERGWSFIKRAGTVILAASVIIWVLNSLSFEGGFHYITEENGGASILEFLGGLIAWFFKPLGFGTWQAAVATLLGLVAKEEVVGVFGSLTSMADADLAFELVDSMNSEKLALIGQEIFGSSKLSGFSFMVFNLLCAPCFAAMGAIRREMNNPKWTVGTIAYMCGFAYMMSLMVYQFGSWFVGQGNIIGTVAATIVLVALIYLLFRKDKYEDSKLSENLVTAGK